jgi:uncharacterized protein (TIGR02001 family)
MTRGFAALALVAAASVAHAGEFSATVTAVSDYDFRGVTQSAQDPALQASVDFAADTGFYAGIWGSNVDFGNGDPNIEVDYYAGWGGGEDVTWDLGILYYTYVGSGGGNYPEAYLGVGWKYFEAKAWYGWNYAGTDGNERYFEGNVTYPLPANFGLTGHIGYTNGNGVSDLYVDPEGNCQSSYMDWSVGVTYSWNHIDMALKWVDGSDLKVMDDTYPDDISSSEARAIFQISTTFPWKDE